MAKLVVPFRIVYQTDKAVVPFNNADMFMMLKVLISRFMKPALLCLITSSAEVLKLVLDKKEGHVDYNKVDICFNAETSLKELTGKKKVAR